MHQEYLYIDSIEKNNLIKPEQLWGFSIGFPRQKTAVNKFLLVSGWVLGKEVPAVTIEVICNSQVINTAHINLPRQGVPNNYPQAQGSWVGNCGFVALIELNKISSTSEISIEAILSDQTRISLAKVKHSSKTQEQLVDSELDLIAQTTQAQVMLTSNKIEEAIFACQVVRWQKTDPPAGFYQTWGDTLQKNNQWEESIAAYKTALELMPENHTIYMSMARYFYHKVQLDGVIDSYQKAIKLKPDLPFSLYQKLAGVLRQQGREQEAKTLLKSVPLPKDGEKYLNIWQALNQTNLASLEEESANYPTNINPLEAEQYFSSTSDYKVIELASLSEEDILFINSLGLSLEYLKLNQASSITSAGATPEESDKISDSSRSDQNHQKWSEDLYLMGKYQVSMIKEGYISAICPYTGEVLSSNSSFSFVETESFCYRFVGKEVFYLVTGKSLNLKSYFYFPKIDTIIYLSKHPIPVANQALSNPKLLNALKGSLVASWQRIKSYLLNRSEAKTAVFLGANLTSTAHHIWNDLSGIQKLYDNGLLHKVDNFFVTVQEFYGGIEEIFPEIPVEKVKRIKRGQEQTEILNNNYFALRLSDVWVNNNLANRIYQTSQNKCSSAFLETVEVAKQSHFPLLWINFRTGMRTWVSKVDGIASLIKSLSEQYPNLGVVFDGCSYVDIKGKLLVNERLEATVKKEKETINKIKALLPSDIKVYDIIGSPMYEVIVWAKTVDLYLAPWGGGLAKIISIANKPGVVHTNKMNTQSFFNRGNNTYSAHRENPVLPVHIPERYITDGPEDRFSRQDQMQRSYEFDWRIAYEELVKIISFLEASRG